MKQLSFFQFETPEIFQNIINYLNRLGIDNIVFAIILFVLGYIVIRQIYRTMSKLLAKTGMDSNLEKFTKGFKLSKVIAKFIYYFLFIYLTVIVLNILGVTEVLQPISDMMSKLFTYIPNIIIAAFVGFIGWVLATIVSQVVELSGNTIEAFTSKLNVEGINIVNLSKKIVFLLIFIPFVIIAIDILNISVISDPAKNLLGELMDAVPNILTAIVILVIFYILARFISIAVYELAKNAGTDNIPEKMSFNKMMGTYSLSGIIRILVFYFIMFSGLISALGKLEMTRLADTFNELIIIAGQIAFGAIILIVGNAIAIIIVKAIKNTGAHFVAKVAHFAIIGLFIAIALRAMGIANEIVELAFGLTLGAIAVAFALSFGLGGRAAAGKALSEFFDKLKKEIKY